MSDYYEARIEQPRIGLVSCPYIIDVKCADYKLFKEVVEYIRQFEDVRSKHEQSKD